MKKNIIQKPKKLTDAELFQQIDDRIINGKYIITAHAQKRQTERAVTDLDVLKILKGEKKSKRKRNKRKDTYVQGKEDWNYCIEGLDIDENKIRIIISFNQEILLVITIIPL